jgi:hypothetical protein
MLVGRWRDRPDDPVCLTKSRQMCARSASASVCTAATLACVGTSAFGNGKTPSFAAITARSITFCSSRTLPGHRRCFKGFYQVLGDLIDQPGTLRLC